MVDAATGTKFTFSGGSSGVTATSPLVHGWILGSDNNITPGSRGDPRE